jgi:YidC/Oxa1 family membrane protein insertase
MMQNGVKVAKTLTFKRGSYLIDVAWEIANGGDKAIAPHAYFQLQRDDAAPEGETMMVSTFTGPAVYTDAEKYQKVAFSDIADNKAKFAKTADNGWLAMVQHYFVSAWVPKDKTSASSTCARWKAATLPGRRDRAGRRNCTGRQGRNLVSLYAGPQGTGCAEAGCPGLDLVVDYGWLTVVAAPIFWALEAIHKLVGNWGWAIVVLTIMIKAVFFPLSAASYKSMAKMKVLTPRLMQLKERFGDDKQRLNQEMMKLYQTEKVNPLGGCLPILVQIPVFIALYWVLLGAVEMRGCAVDHVDHRSGFARSLLHPAGHHDGISMFVQTKLNPTPPDPIQAKVMMAMPLIFGVMFFWFPAGLVLYWVVNNMLSIAQQWQITRMIDAGGKAANDAESLRCETTPSLPSPRPPAVAVSASSASRAAICCPLLLR